jgi:hypothetical protein
MISGIRMTGAAKRSLLLAAALVLAACAEMEAKERTSSLETSTNAYAAALRWGQYQEAARFRLPKSGPVGMPDLEPLQNIRLTSYEVTDQVVNPEVTEARIDVVIGYYHTDIGRVESLKQSQLWWYEPTEKHWFLDTDLPPFLQYYMRRR